MQPEIEVSVPEPETPVEETQAPKVEEVTTE